MYQIDLILKLVFFPLGNADAKLSDLPEQVCAVSSVAVYLLRKSS